MPITAEMQGLGAIKGVPLGGGFRAPPTSTITATDVEDFPYDVTLKVELIDGRYQCTEMGCTQRAGGPPVTTNGLRTLRIGWLIAAALEGMVMKVDPNPQAEGEWIARPVGAWSDESVKVAAVYRLAYACGLNPTSEVAASLGVSKSVASNRVMKARRAGLLDPTEKGKARAGGST